MEGNDVELVSKLDLLKVKDEMILGTQDWFENHVELMMERVFCSLFSKEASGHSIFVNSEVCKPNKAANIGVDQQMEEVKGKSEQVKDKLQRKVEKYKHTMGVKKKVVH